MPTPKITKVVVNVRMTPEEREQLDRLYKQSVFKSRSEYILNALKRQMSWTEQR